MTIIGLVFPYRFTARIRGGANKKLFFFFPFLLWKGGPRKTKDEEKKKQSLNNGFLFTSSCVHCLSLSFFLSFFLSPSYYT